MNLSTKKYKNLTFLSLIIPISIALFSVVLVHAESEEEIPALHDQKVQDGYILNIRDLIKKSKQKIEEANEKIKDQAIRRRNLQREEKARDCYDKAMRYYEQGNLKKAQDYWEKAIEITDHPEMRGYLKESVKKTKLQKEMLSKEEERRLKRLEVERGYTVVEVEEAYNTAVSLFKQGKYLVSKEEFENVEEMFPDHRATRSYMMIIDQKIQEDQQASIDEKLKKEASVRRQEKEAWRKELETREENRRAKLEKQAEAIYEDALKYYRAREFEKAKERFKEVEFILPDYKSTVRYLINVDNEIEKDTIIGLEKRKEKVDKEYDDEKALRRIQEERRILSIELEERDVVDRLKEEAGFIYDAAIVLYEKGELYRAREKFSEVREMYPDYKYTQKYIDRIDVQLEKDVDQRFERERREFEYEMAEKEKERSRLEKIAILKREQAEMERIEKLEREAESLYRKAVSLYDNGLYEESYVEFEEIQMLYPKYKAVESYLDRIDKKIEEQSDQEEQTRLLMEQRRKREEKLAKEREDARRLKLLEEEEREWVKRLEEEASVLYEAAISHYKKKLYDKAKDKFEEVQLLYPDYKSTTKYLENIDYVIEEEKNIKQEREQREFERQLKEEALQKEREERERRLRDEKAENDKIRELNISAEHAYKVAVLLYNKQLYIQAEEKFQEVQDIIAGYKKTEDFIKKIKKEVLEAERNKEEEEQRELAIKLRNENLEKKRLEERRRKQLLQEEKQKKKIKEETVSRNYKSALKYYNKKLYKISKEKFEKVSSEYPHYKLVDRYLIEVDNKIKSSKFYEMQEKRKMQEQKLREDDLEKRKKDLTKSKIERLNEKEENNNLRKEADILYRSALILCKKKLYSECRKKFFEIEAIYPDYKSTAKYIARLDWLDKGKVEDASVITEEEIVDKKLIDDDKKMLEEKEYQEIKERTKGYDKSSTVDEISVIKNLTEEENYIKEEEEKRNKKLFLQAEAKYKEAIKFYKASSYIDAKIKFIQVEAIVPGYKDTTDYLYNIDADIERNQEKLRNKEQSKQEKELVVSKENKEVILKIKEEEDASGIRFEKEASEMYQRAVKLYKDKQYELARVKFMEVEQLVPGYKKTKNYISKIDILIDKQIAKNEVEKQSNKVKAIKEDTSVSFDKEASEMYQRAVRQYKDKQYEVARAQFMKVGKLIPGYRNADKYIIKIDRIIKKQVAQKKVKNQEVKSDIEGEYDWKKASEIRAAKIKADEKRKEYVDEKNNKEFKLQQREEKRIEAEQERQRKRLEKKEERNAILEQKKKDKLRKKSLIADDYNTEAEIKEAEELQKQLLHNIEEQKQKAEQEAIEAKRIEEKRIEKEAFKKQKAEQEVIEAKRIEEKRIEKAEQEVVEKQKIEQELEEKKKVEQQTIELKLIEKDAETEMKLIKKALTRSDRNKKKVLKKQAREIEKLEKIRNVQDAKRMNVSSSLFVDYDQKGLEQAERNKRKIMNKQQRIIEGLKSKNRKEDSSRWGSSINDIYLDGLRSFENKNYEAAKVLFSLVEELDPDHDKARQYNLLSEMKAEKFKKQKFEQEENDKKLLKDKKEKLDKLAQERIDSLLKEEMKLKEENEAKDNEEKEILRKKQTELIRGLKIDLDKEYKEAVALSKNEDLEKFGEKFKKVEQILSENDFDEKYKASIRKRMAKERDKIIQKLEMKKRDNEILMKRNEEKMRKEKERLEQEKKKELEILKNRLEIEKKKVESEKLKEEMEIEKLKLKEEWLASKEQLKEEKIKNKELEIKRREEVRMLKLEKMEKEKERNRLSKRSGEKSKVSDLKVEKVNEVIVVDDKKAENGDQLEKDKRTQLALLVKKRQQELQEEREKVRIEFEENL
ncbi:MAG: hypothetical protein KKF78_08970, partial [Candidatus Omnitrophica bacterium]|nr:hypothetical protein [Candidatus Omnitrophota bacterium]